MPRANSRRRRKFRNRSALLEQLESRMLLALDPFSRLISDSISTPGEQDIWPLEVDSPREFAISLDTSIGDDFNAWLGAGSIELRAPDGELLRSTTAFSDVFLNPVVAEELGTYTIVVQSHPSRADATGAYDLHIADQRPAPTRSVAAADWIVTEFEVFRQKQAFEFSVSEADLGNPIKFALQSPGGTPNVQVIDPQGDLARTVGAAPNDVFTPLAVADGGAGPGTYQFLLGSGVAGFVGPLQFSVTSRSSDVQPLVRGVLNSGWIDTFGGQEFWSFDGEAGESVTISASGTFSNSFVPDLLLLGPSGEAVAGAFSNQSSLAVDLPETGSYRLRVDGSGQGNTGTGGYTVSVTAAPEDAGQILFGSSREVDLPVAGSEVTLEFVASPEHVGRRVTVRALQAPFNLRPRLVVTDPQGNELGDTGPFPSGDPRLGDIVLSEAGVYRIRVSEENGFAGRIRVGLSDQPNRSPEPLTVGQKSVHTITSFGQVQEFSITPSRAEPLTVAGTLTTNFNLMAAVYDSAGEVVASAANFTGTGPGRLNFVPEAGESYRLRFEPISAFAGRGIYTLELTENSVPAVWPDDVAATVALTDGESLLGRLADENDIDVYTFEATRGDEVRLVVSGGRDGSVLTRPEVRVFAPGGILTWQDGIGNGPLEIDTRDFRVPVSGVYRVEVSPGRASNQPAPGPYRLSFANNSLGSATPILLESGVSLQGSIDQVAEQDLFAFDYELGTSVYLQALSARPQRQPLELDVFAPSGRRLYRVVGETNRDGFAWYPRIGPSQLPEAGRYLVRLRTAVASTSSQITEGIDYRILFNAEPTAPTLPLENATPVTGVIGPASTEARYSIVLNAGQTLHAAARSLNVTTHHDPEQPDVDLEVWSPQGELIGHFERGRDASFRELLAEESGSYTIVVRARAGVVYDLIASVDSDGPTTVGLGESVTGILRRGVDLHVVELDVNEPTSVDLRVRGLEPTFLAVAHLMTADGRRLSSRNGAIGQEVRFDRVLVGPGDYLLLSSDFADRLVSEAGSRPDPSGVSTGFLVEMIESTPVTLAATPSETIAIGETREVVVENAGEQPQYRLPIGVSDVGQPVSITVGTRPFADSFSAVLELFDPDGFLVGTDEGRNQTDYFSAPQITDFVPRVAGDYTIRIREHGDDATSTFPLGVSDQRVPAQVPLPEFGELVESAVDYAGDVDVWTFSGQAGDVVRLQKLTGRFSVVLRANGQTLGQLAGINDGESSDRVVLPVTGTYEVEVRARIEPDAQGNTFVRGTSGPYRFRLHKEQTTAPLSIAFGQVVDVPAGSLGQPQVLQFTAAPEDVGRPVTITVGARESISGYTAEITLFGPAGNQLAVSTVTGFGGASFIPRIDDLVLPVSGQYRIQVRDIRDAATSAFTVTLSDQPGNAVELIPDAAAVSASLAVPGAVDTYSFSAGGGQQFRVNVDSATSGVAAAFEIVDSLGQVRATSEFASGDTMVDRFHVPADDTYQIRVRATNTVGASSDRAVDYTIELLDIGNYAQLVTDAVTAAPTLSTSDPASLEVSWRVSNVGTDRGPTERWSDAIVLSRDATFGNSDDRVVETFVRNQGLDPTESYSRTETVLLPAATEGEFYLFVVADSDSVVFEDDLETDNAASADGTVLVALRPFADLALDEVTAPADAQSGQTLSVSWTVTNDAARSLATTDSITWTDTVLLVADPALPPTGSNVVASLGSLQHSGALAVGESYTATADFDIPIALQGTYYAAVRTNIGGRRPYEFIYTDNNEGVSGPIVISQSPLPNLQVLDPADAASSIVAPPTAEDGQTVDISWTVSNRGGASAEGNWWDRVFLREVNGNRSYFLGQFLFDGGLAVQESYTRTEQATLPSRITGVFQVEVQTDAFGAVVEIDEDDNVTLDDTTLSLAVPVRPDLQVREIVAADQMAAGETYAAQFDVVNQGGVATSDGRWFDRLYLSQDGAVSHEDILLGSVVNGRSLESGGSYRSELIEFAVPVDLRGTWFLIAVADAFDTVNEFPADTNNTLARPVEIIPIPPADLVTANVVAPDQVFAGTEIEVRYLVTNHGVGPTSSETWQDTLWLADNRRRPAAGQGTGDLLLGSVGHTGQLAVGESYLQTVRLRLPRTLASGEYFITPFADYYDAVIEDTRDTHINPDDPTEFDNNNYKARPITVVGVPAPDIVVSNVTGPISATGGDEVVVSWTVTNAGERPTLLTAWQDRILLANGPTRMPGI